MTLELLKGKIHRATVIQAELDYVGSITVDEALLEAAGILEYEKVQIVDVAGGILLAELCFFIGRKTQLYRIYEKLGSRIEKKILKITEG